MGVPLAAYSVEDEEGNQKVEVWYNGGSEVVAPNAGPRIYSSSRLASNLVDRAGAVGDSVPGRWLDRVERDVCWRYRFPSDKARRTVEILAQPLRGESMDTLMASLIEDPDFFRQFPQETELKVGVFDLETWTKNNVFSDPHLNPIIASCLNGNLVMGDGESDEEICCKLVEELTEFEVISNHNVRRFDLWFLSERCAVNNIDISVLSKDFSGLRTIGKRWQDLWLYGRVVFDTWLDGTALDQKLSGVGRGLKSVAEYWGIPYKDLVSKGNMCDLVGTEELAEYVRSDVELAQKFFNHYFPMRWQVAEYLGAPFNMVLEKKSSFPSSIIQGRAMRAAGVYSSGSNEERHPFLNWSGNTYQSAVVLVVALCRKCRKYFLYGKDFWVCPHCGMDVRVCGESWIQQGGLYEEVVKLDFMSYYDWLQILLNLSSETTRMVGLEPYPQGDGYPLPKCKVEGKKRILKIPDNVVRKTWVIETDLSFESLTVSQLRDLLWERQKLKKEMKALPQGTRKDMLDSKQNALKVVGKTFSGCNAQMYVPYGSIPVTVVIVGVGRDGLMFIKSWLEKNYGVEVQIEYDTDGVYIREEVDIERLNKDLNEYMMGKYGITSEFIIEMETFGPGIFFGRKTYLLWDDKKLKVVGTALKSTRKPPLWGDVVQAWGKQLLRDGDSKISIPFDIRGLPIDKYVMRVTLNKHPWDYGGKGLRLELDLAQQASKYGVPMSRGSTHSYVESRPFRYSFDGGRFGSTHKIMQSVGGSGEVKIKHYSDMVVGLKNKFNRVLGSEVTLDSF